MKNILIIACAILMTFSLAAQQGEKGARPIPVSPKAAAGVTRAIVIGISDYQDALLPDLRFADRDAQAFAGFLRSKAGGSLSDDQIKLLTNEQATAGTIYMGLDWLVDDSQEGDLAIIYFSGHGDAEVKMHSKPGFLLTYDTPAGTMKTASISLNLLEEFIATLTLVNKSKVLVITDACRSGKLGGRVGGSKMANTELATMSEKAVKILSCQPEELSFESIQWGGGRGAFSYFLVNGLYGLADKNTDQQVTLTEIGRYLEDNVSREVSPSSQFPMVVGNPKEKLADVFPEELAMIMEDKEPYAVYFKPVDPRGIEDEVLARVDSATRQMYRQFKEAVVAKQFFEPAYASADTFYNQLTRVPELQPLYNIMKRNYAAALMDDAQEAMNGWLRGDLQETESWVTDRRNDYRKFPPQLEKAADLLGAAHYLYKDLMAKAYFFRARVHISTTREWDSTDLTQLLQIVEEGLKYDSLAPYLYAKKAYYFGYKGDYEKEPETLKKTMSLAPSWIYAYFQLAYRQMLHREDIKNAQKYALQGYQIDSTNLKLLEILNICYARSHQFEKYKSIARQFIQGIESNAFFREKEWECYTGIRYWENGNPGKAVPLLTKYLQQEFDSAYFHGGAFTSPHWVYNIVGWAEYVQGNEAEAEKWWLQGDSINENSLAKAGLFLLAHQRGQYQMADDYIDKAMNLWWYNQPFYFLTDGLRLAGLYGRVDETILLFTKGLEHYHDYAPLHYHLGRLYLDQKHDYGKGMPLLERAVQLDSTDVYALYQLAAAYAHLDREEAALAYLKKALHNGHDDLEELAADGRWERLRMAKKYKDLMQQYFPEKAKD